MLSLSFDRQSPPERKALMTKLPTTLPWFESPRQGTDLRAGVKGFLDLFRISLAIGRGRTGHGRHRRDRISCRHSSAKRISGSSKICELGRIPSVTGGDRRQAQCCTASGTGRFTHSVAVCCVSSGTFLVSGNEIITIASGGSLKDQPPENCRKQHDEEKGLQSQCRTQHNAVL